MTSYRYFRKTRRALPEAAPPVLLPPGLQNHPIRDHFAPPDRRLTLALTAMSLVLLVGGTAYFTILSQRYRLEVTQGRLQTVSLLLDEGGDGRPAGPSAPAGGSQNQEQVDHPLLEPLSPMNVLAVRTNPEDETLVPLTPPEKLPDSSRQLVSLDPGLLPATIPGQGNGIGSGLGSEIGNGLGSGLGHGRGSTWIHSAQGDEQLKVAVNFLDVKDYTPPDYPEEARSRGISGDVVLAVTIDREGAPVKWSVVEGQPSLVAATLKAFPKWHFIAPVYKGEKVGASFEVRVRFTLM